MSEIIETNVNNADEHLSAEELKQEQTKETEKMKKEFGFFGPAAFGYAVLYAFCMYKNDAGITFPFFVAGSLLFLCFSLKKLGISLKKGSLFYMISMELLAVSTFCTDDAKMIVCSKMAVFFLMMCLLICQFYDTSEWKLVKYLLSVGQLCIGSLRELDRPFQDMAGYFKNNDSKKTKNIWYAGVGILAAVPISWLVLALLGSADVVFRNMMDQIFGKIQIENIFQVVLRIVFVYLAAYLFICYLCDRRIKEQVTDRRNGEPVIAITITGVLSVFYLVFSVVQILYLFIGKMRLPDGYTYAMYAREGFFQLLAVAILNLAIVLAGLNFFRESKVLKGILTTMSLCTFVMILSSAMRMIIYIRYYYLTFLRILVLWALLVLFILFIGVIAEIFGKHFSLFRYSIATVTVLYLLLSFLHPDYLIASFNLRYTGENWNSGSFIKAGEPYSDFYYLGEILSADAAPALIPYMEEHGYVMEDFKRVVEDSNYDALDAERLRCEVSAPSERRFGYIYVWQIEEKLENLSLRRFNLSRYLARKMLAAG